jgi:hypothetical protein
LAPATIRFSVTNTASNPDHHTPEILFDDVRLIMFMSGV